MDPEVVFEDTDLAVLSKSAGMIVNRSDNAPSQTLSDWTALKYKIARTAPDATAADEGFYTRSGVVHRLDKDTSGLLIVAKNERSFLLLQEQFARRTVKKKYIALAHGVLDRPGATIKATVGRLPGNRRKFGVIVGGREAETEYRVLNYYQKGKERYTLVEAAPRTGRTHQIRIHFKYIGHSLVGDKLYSGKNVEREDLTFCPRLFLHAGYLEFQHSRTGKRIAVNSPLPHELEKTLEKLQKMS